MLGESIEARSSDAAKFNTTHWSMVLLAGNEANPQAAAALESLCKTYWYPLYAYVRRKGYSSHDAQDLTQEFFARFLEKNYFQLASPERGKFRSFLLKSLDRFLVNDWVRKRAQKRGAGQTLISIDEADAEHLYQQEPAVKPPPEVFYDKKWALVLLDSALRRVSGEYARGGKGAVFAHLKGLILSEASGETYHGVAGSLGMSEAAVKVALHRLRARFRNAVREEVGHTVTSPGEVDEELRCLISTLST